MTGASAAVGGETSTDSWQRISTPASTVGPWLPEGDLGARLAEGLSRVEEALLTAVGSEHSFVREAAGHLVAAGGKRFRPLLALLAAELGDPRAEGVTEAAVVCELTQDRKSTRLNSSHANISYAVFCLKKKKEKKLQ